MKIVKYFLSRSNQPKLLSELSNIEFLGEPVAARLLTWIFVMMTAWCGREKLHCWWALLANLFQCENLSQYHLFYFEMKISASADEFSFACIYQMIDPGGIANRTVTHVDWSERKWHPKSYKAPDVNYELLKNMTVIMLSYISSWTRFVNKAQAPFPLLKRIQPDLCDIILHGSVSFKSWV